MTTNQIAYWTMQESKRANLAKEFETAQHNRITEAETERNNRATLTEQARRTDIQSRDAALDRTSREGIASLDRYSREGIAASDRTSREGIASADRDARVSIADADREMSRKIANANNQNAAARQQAELTTRANIANAELGYKYQALHDDNILRQYSIQQNAINILEQLQVQIANKITDVQAQQLSDAIGLLGTILGASIRSGTFSDETLDDKLSTGSGWRLNGTPTDQLRNPSLGY